MLKMIGLTILGALLISVVVMTSFIIAMAISLGICDLLISVEENIKNKRGINNMNKNELRNGDELILRNGDIIYHLNGTLYEMRNNGDMYAIKDYAFDDDLKHYENCDFDVVKVVYEDEIVFERSIDWNEVAMGTPVIAWDDGIDKLYEGKFIYYDPNDDEIKFLALVNYEREDDDGNIFEETDAVWFNRCRLKEGK